MSASSRHFLDLSTEELLIVNLLRKLISNDKSIGFLSGHSLEAINWSKLIEICLKHKILGFVAYQIETDPPFFSSLPADIQQTLQNAVNEHRFSFAEKKMQFKKIAAFLGEGGVLLIPLKGILLSFDMYKDIPFRVMNDMDILVRQEDLDKAVEILEFNGFKPLFHPYRNRWHSEIFQESLLSSGEFWKVNQSNSYGNGKIDLDLHIGLRAWVNGEKVILDNDFLWKSCSVSSALGRNIYTLSEVRHFFFLVMHAADQYSPRFSQLLDIAFFMRRNTNYRALLDQEMVFLSSSARQKISDFCHTIEEVFIKDCDSSTYSKEARNLLKNFFEIRRAKDHDEHGQWKERFSRIQSKRTRMKFLLGYLLPDPVYYKKHRIKGMYWAHFKDLLQKAGLFKS